MKMIVSVVIAILLVIGGGLAVEALIWHAPTTASVTHPATGTVTGVFEFGGGPPRPGCMCQTLQGTVYLYAPQSCPGWEAPPCNPKAGRLLAIARSISDGRFMIEAPPGRYDLVGSSDKFGHGMIVPGYLNEVTVVGGAIVKKDISLSVP
jgi:hypothetical protein